jgi:hypothetical protein
MQLIYFHARAIFIAKSIKIIACMCVREGGGGREGIEKREVICLITNTVIVTTQNKKVFEFTTYFNKHAL